MTFFHIYSSYEPRDPSDCRRVRFARACWKTMYCHNLKNAGIPDRQLTMFRDTARKLPFVKELIRVGSRLADENDVIILTNSDVCCPENITGILDLILTQADACYSYRRDFLLLKRILTLDEIETGTFSHGCELFAFRMSWWLANAALMPDMLLGAEAWDWCLRKIIDRAERGKMMSFVNLSYHESHESVWIQEQNRRTLPSQLYNLELARKFESEHDLYERSIH